MSNQINKSLFQLMNARPITCNPIYSELCGKVKVSNLTKLPYREKDQGAGILLSQLLYWYSSMKSVEFWKNDVELIQECGANAYAYEQDKKRLIDLEFVTYTKKGHPCRGYWIVNEDKIIQAFLDLQPVSNTVPLSSVKLVPLSSAEPVPLSSVKLVPLSSAEPIYTPEITPEMTSESGDFSNEKPLAQKILKVKEVEKSLLPPIKVSPKQKAEDNIVAEFKAEPIFEINCERYAKGLTPGQVDHVLHCIANKHVQDNQPYKGIYITEFINWSANESKKIAKEQSQATSKPSYQSNYKSPYQPSSEANAETSVDSGRYQQYTSDSVNVLGDPTSYETEAAWKEFVDKQREQKNTVCADDLKMAVARKQWASKDVYAEINKVTRYFQNSQTDGSSVSKNDPLDEPVDNDETTTDEFMF